METILKAVRDLRAYEIIETNNSNTNIGCTSPEHTDFCSKQLPPAAQLDSLSGDKVGNMQTPAAAKGELGKRKSSGDKANSKDIIVELLTEMHNQGREKLVRFGMAKLPEAMEMKKNINEMISSQGTSAKHAATKMQWH